jgi:membrane protein YdbS with pleckstrin-like domain
VALPPGSEKSADGILSWLLALSGAWAAAVAVTVVIIVVTSILVVSIAIIAMVIDAIMVVSVVPDLVRWSAARGERRGRQASLHRLQHGPPLSVATIHCETLLVKVAALKPPRQC